MSFRDISFSTWKADPGMRRIVSRNSSPMEAGESCKKVYRNYLNHSWPASYGGGTMVCRTGKGFTGPWGAPAMCPLEGGSVGLQIGEEATDFVFLVMNDRGAGSLLRPR
jgi:hypothetical protein